MLASVETTRLSHGMALTGYNSRVSISWTFNGLPTVQFFNAEQGTSGFEGKKRGVFCRGGLFAGRGVCVGENCLDGPPIAR
ncbi:hypothetical protein WG66_007956 [Moniliophthora roreri]|nr:hypothetical protein WG66_007956 [Moniliophthora roreri]